LGLVDGEMRGNGAREALFGEDLVGFGFSGRESVTTVSIRIATEASSEDAVSVSAVTGFRTSAAPCCGPLAVSSYPAPPPVANQAERGASKPC
jgi:hypothetical protein